jgi:peptidylprolyl isomerase
MTGIREGDLVRVHYTGKLQNGEIFDSSDGEDPLNVKVGEGNIIPGFERALIGMEVGEKKTFDLTPEQAFGQRRDELVHVVDRNQISTDMKLEVGMQLALKGKEEEPIPAHIVDLTDSTVTIDTNHPLAGKSLIFEIDVLDVER